MLFIDNSTVIHTTIYFSPFYHFFGKVIKITGVIYWSRHDIFKSNEVFDVDTSRIAELTSAKVSTLSMGMFET
ncbi:hypothetical protein ECANGB1_2146 [Enterospora canceri]|uniref:Uncharacterized protein n=1 Tax=Enterospora canceri TaxID=1081671 RepID=A0A1Y1S5P7_9MICR|nr:hypothetical protein ECANGB1_2146 [Enterospora canceri]